MTITDSLMKPGGIRVELVNDYPQWLAKAIDYFDHIVVTANRLEPITAYSDANILANAIATGPLTNRPSPRMFEGYLMPYWLGSPNGLGDLLDTPITRTTGTLAQWVTDLCPASLTVGTVNNAGTSTVTNAYQWVTRREALDAVCRSAGAEWRVNPNGTIDAGTPANMFRTTPRVIITRRPEGIGGELVGLDGGLIVAPGDVEQYTTKAIAVVKGEGSTVPTGSATNASPYKDLNNNAVVMERLVNAPTEPSANANTVAAAVLGQFSAPRRKLTVSSRTYAIPRHARPGDTVYLFDELAGLVDPANQVMFRGDLIQPVKMRVISQTYPIESGMGVYVRRSGSPATYIDVTRWVKFEDGTDVRWDVGAISATLLDDTSTAGSVAYLGANLAVAERATDASNPWTAPTLLNSWVDYGGTAATARYRAEGDRTWIEGIVKNGTLGLPIFNLPAARRPAKDQHLATVTNGVFGLLTIVAASGDVVVQSSSNVWASVACSFSTT